MPVGLRTQFVTLSFLATTSQGSRTIVRALYGDVKIEQKRKNQRLKEVNYNYTNAFTNYLWADPREPFVLLTPKDIIALNQQLPEEINKLYIRLADTRPLLFSPDTQPSVSFLQDFMNFWPCWHLRIQQIIQLELSQSQRNEHAFESQYSFPAKVIAHLRLRQPLKRFCAQLFAPTLKQISLLTQQLTVDFGALYQRWQENLELLPNLKKFIENGQIQAKGLSDQFQRLLEQRKSQQQMKKLMTEMTQFAKKQSSLSFLVNEVGQQQVGAGTNLRLGWLVWKRICEHRLKIQKLCTGLLDSIMTAYSTTPQEVKWVVKCYRQACIKKFGTISYQDLKSFFNKAVFSQLFFAQFMYLHSQQPQSPHSNPNLTLLALVSQKIMFGQEFYQKYKFAFLNPTIKRYKSIVQNYIRNFAHPALTIPNTPSSLALASLETLRLLHQLLSIQLGGLSGLSRVLKDSENRGEQRNRGQSLYKVQQKNRGDQRSRGTTSFRAEQKKNDQTNKMQGGQITIGTKVYSLKRVFVSLGSGKRGDYRAVLRPRQKVKRILIDFLLLTQKISEKTSVRALLQQYRCAQEDQVSSKPSVQLYAIYLCQQLPHLDLPGLVQQIQADIALTHTNIHSRKIELQKEYSYSINLQKMYMTLLNQRKEQAAVNKITAQINSIHHQPLGFDYQIFEGKVCQTGIPQVSKTVGQCLSDVAACFRNQMQGVDGLYHILWEKVADKLEKGVVPSNLREKVKEVLGEQLYIKLSLESMQSKVDLQLIKQMKIHSFVQVAMLDLPQYSLQEKLIEIQVKKLALRLRQPLCPDRMLGVFHSMVIAFQNVILITGNANDITADVQIPMMMVALIKSQIPNLDTLLNFMQQFCADDIHSSVLGQTLTLLKSASLLILELNQTRLNISKDQYQEYVIKNTYEIIE